ncbi:phosphoribosylanthranilate isomerase [Bordetella petrii]|uniref:N-(5'-phosphoribosyl)anthranilate isomerase n=1 Tax=Bordetella petrii (strain ATCC BAA-461 / DSM 12804 / CCUG 43448 / CIP 107267 / Se-1111R) TaxID=340100 RepID=TRPF_BORPD|nr:phosphoribosylanthranilate isomerase [Bordetella petrii]A9IRJ9.1 RecName: Full=N-(5'-phosphoribosyl)anthranilate isomerase; Short=PRAI [Bordetella petrii DSM 12804]CAP43184.1 N-(5'-phosphoribosyl)anthranilate isomerase [Bordetella petrii]
MRTRVKICGLTREADIASAVQAGADAIGFVFYPGSKRYVQPVLAARLRRTVPAFVDVVALFVNPAPADVQAVLDQVGPDLIQFHGDESAAECARYGTRFLRAFRTGAPGLDTPGNLAAACRAYDAAAGWLFDSYSAGYGGSGQAFDHALLAGVRADAAARPLILSGGLNAANVGTAIEACRPWAVDVSSGVETAPGEKSPDKIRALLDAVRQADDRLRGL